MLLHTLKPHDKELRYVDIQLSELLVLIAGKVDDQFFTGWKVQVFKMAEKKEMRSHSTHP